MPPLNPSDGALPRIAWKPREFADMTGMDYSAVLDRIADGTIPATKFGTTYRIPDSYVRQVAGEVVDDDVAPVLRSVDEMSRRGPIAA